MIREAINKTTEKISNESNNLFEGKNATGTCYQDALHYMEKHSDKKLRLVHGLVTGQGPIEGIRYNHAWVEDGNEVIDPSLKELGRSVYTFPKDLYYAIGNIKEKTTFRYNHKEMVKKMLEIGTYGPWEKVLMDNKD